jgi:hypothetical protein
MAQIWKLERQNSVQVPSNKDSNKRINKYKSELVEVQNIRWDKGAPNQQMIILFRIRMWIIN